VSHDREEWRRPWRVEDPLPPGARLIDETGPFDGRPAAFSPAPGTTEAESADLDTRATTPSAWDADELHSTWTPSPSTEGDVLPPPPATSDDAPRRGGRLLIVGTLLGALIGGAVGAALTLVVVDPQRSEGPAPAPADANPGTPTVEPTRDLDVVTAVAQAVTPSVVRIDVSDGSGGPGGAIGSGVIYRADGYVLTNHHVIEPALENDLQVTVRLASGDVIDAEIVGSDQLNDLAVVRVDRDGLPAIQVRPSDEPLLVGETVVAIGSPFGLDASVTAGIISALNREIRVDDPAGAGSVIPSVIQTDAAINPGNSGGALVDARGRLIGINTAILTRSGASQGVGFAVSAEQAISSADQLIEQGFVRHPLLGITGVDVTPEIAEQFGLPASRGAVVESVQPDTGADDAGLLPGDIIIEVDGEPLATMSQLVAEVRARAPGDAVRLQIVRDGDQIEVDVVLGERPRD
jgi:S1-C subfamily serine protease